MLIALMIATIMDPILPVAAGVALLAFALAVYELAKRRIVDSLACLLLSALAAYYVVVAFPTFPRHSNSLVIGDCRSIFSSEDAYPSANGGAFGQLSCLASPTSCGFPAGTVPFLDSQLAALTDRHGYSRRFVAGPRGSGSPDPGIRSFVYVAIPLRVEEGAFGGFAVDSSGLICFTTDGTSPPILNGMLAPACLPLK